MKRLLEYYIKKTFTTVGFKVLKESRNKYVIYLGNKDILHIYFEDSVIEDKSRKEFKIRFYYIKEELKKNI